MAQWVGGPGKGSQKHTHLWRTPWNLPPKTRNFFFDFDYKTCWIRRGFEQLSRSIAWRVIRLQSSARNVAFAVLKLRQVSMLCHFCLFLSCVHGVFNSPVATPSYGLLGLRSSFRLRFISQNVSLLALHVCSTTCSHTSLSC